MSFYELLEVADDATPEEIRAAYLRLAQQHHPDRHVGEPSTEQRVRFNEIREAYEVLYDADQRRAYDNTRSIPRRRERQHGGQATAQAGQAVVTPINPSVRRDVPDEWLSRSAPRRKRKRPIRTMMFVAVLVGLAVAVVPRCSRYIEEHAGWAEVMPIEDFSSRQLGPPVSTEPTVSEFDLPKINAQPGSSINEVTESRVRDSNVETASATEEIDTLPTPNLEDVEIPELEGVAVPDLEGFEFNFADSESVLAAGSGYLPSVENDLFGSRLEPTPGLSEPATESGLLPDNGIHISPKQAKPSPQPWNEPLTTRRFGEPNQNFDSPPNFLNRRDPLNRNRSNPLDRNRPAQKYGFSLPGTESGGDLELGRIGVNPWQAPPPRLTNEDPNYSPGSSRGRLNSIHGYSPMETPLRPSQLPGGRSSGIGGGSGFGGASAGGVPPPW